jgi:hypothetical protein
VTGNGLLGFGAGVEDGAPDELGFRLTPRTSHVRWTGNSAFAESMSLNLIDFPPWRKKRGPLQDVPLLAEDLVLTAQPFQSADHIIVFCLAWPINLPIPASRDPSHQHRKPDPQIGSDPPLGSAAGLNQLNGLGLKFLREPSRSRHGGSPASRGTLHFSGASPPKARALPLEHLMIDRLDKQNRPKGEAAPLTRDSFRWLARPHVTDG